MGRHDEFPTSRTKPGAGQPGLPCQSGPEVPWELPPKKLLPFRFRQFGDSLQIHLDTGLEGLSGALKRVALDGDIKVGTNGLPTAAISAGITP